MKRMLKSLSLFTALTALILLMPGCPTSEDAPYYPQYVAAPYLVSVIEGAAAGIVIGTLDDEDNLVANTVSGDIIAKLEAVGSALDVQYSSGSLRFALTPAANFYFNPAEAAYDTVAAALAAKLAPITNHVDPSLYTDLDSVTAELTAGQLVLTAAMYTENTGLVDKLVEYFENTVINVTIPAAGNPAAPALTTTAALDALNPPNTASPATIAYTDGTAEEAPYLTYTLGFTDAQYNRVEFTGANVERVIAAIKQGFGSITNNRNPDGTVEGYAYYGEFSYTFVQFPDPAAGSIRIRINLAKDTAVPAIATAINDIAAVTITAGGVTGFDASWSAAYVSADKKLMVTVPASGITDSGMQSVAQVLLGALAGKITNGVDAGYVTVPSASAERSGANIVVTLQLDLQNVTAQNLTQLITPAAGTINITGAVVSGDVITRLTGIANMTGAATGAYDSAAKTITVTVPPAAGWAFLTAGDAYNTTLTALADKFANITNNVDAPFVTVDSSSYTLTGGNLVFTLKLNNYIPAAAITAVVNTVPDNSGITVASLSNVTGAVVTALAGFPDANTAASYTQNPGIILITLTAKNGYAFGVNTGVTTNPYTAVAAAIRNKVGSGTGAGSDKVANALDPNYLNINTAGAEVRGNGTQLQFSFALRAGYVTAASITAALNSVPDTSGLTIAGGGVTGTVVNALANISGATGAVTASYNSANKRVTIVVNAPGEATFNTAANTYAAVTTAIQNKIGAAVTNSVDTAYVNRGQLTLSVTPASLTWAFPVTLPAVSAETIATAIEAAANGNITIVNQGSVTGAVISALANIPGATGAVGLNYDNGQHQLRFTVAPAAGVSFDTATTYAAVTTALRTKLESGIITNNVETAYTLVSAAAQAAANASMTFTFTLAMPAVSADTLAATIAAAANGSFNVASTSDISGSIVTALRDLTANISQVLPAYNTGTHAIVLTLRPAAGKGFSGSYAAVAAALNAKTGSVTNAVESKYAAKGTATQALSGAELILTIPVTAPVIAVDTVTAAITSAASGDLNVASASSVTGGIVTGLQGITEVASVATSYDPATYSATITVTPNAVNTFNDTDNFYRDSITALTAKLNGGTHVNAVNSIKVIIGSVGGSVIASGNLVITVAFASDYPANILTAAIEAIADGNLIITPAGMWGGSLSVVGDVPGAIGNVVGSVGMGWASNNLTITCTPATGDKFITSNGAYNVSAAALQTVLATGTMTVNAVDFWGNPNGTSTIRRADTVTVTVNNAGACVFTVTTVAQ